MSNIYYIEIWRKENTTVPITCYFWLVHNLYGVNLNWNETSWIERQRQNYKTFRMSFNLWIVIERTPKSLTSHTSRAESNSMRWIGIVCYFIGKYKSQEADQRSGQHHHKKTTKTKTKTKKNHEITVNEQYASELEIHMINIRLQMCLYD